MNDRVRLAHGDCLVCLPWLEDNSVDSIVTDPPYGLGFMGKEWDALPPSREVFAECLRVLKPGGHMLVFGGTRTQHRMVCAVEDAGFEIRDTIAWVYGSGFPKSHDVSKGIDKAARGFPQGGPDPTSKNHGKYKGGCSDDNPSGRGFGAGPGLFMAEKGESETRELVPEAQQWGGWGTAFKPALEFVCVARKPLDGTVVKNVMKWGTGAINVDGCRVEIDPTVDDPRLGGQGTWGTGKMAKNVYSGGYAGETVSSFSLGRWPANLIHDGSDEVVGLLGSAARFFYCAKASKADRNEGLEQRELQPSAASQFRPNHTEKAAQGESGNPYGRWKPERNNHPTVKPTKLMRYLCRLVTPSGGVVLDPFMGSGSTGKAALLEGFRFIGIEKDADSFAIARERIAHASR